MVYKWNPSEIGKMHVDDLDSTGIYYWYEDAKSIIKIFEKTGGLL